ncbi:MAG: hypothetical protein WCT12_15970 [Verrucomicrobiota bacterium]
MKSPSRKCLFAFGALLLLSLVIWSALRLRSAPAPLAVVLVGVQDKPLSHKGPTVRNGGRGPYAIFAFTNSSTHDSVWFNVWALEQKVGAEWRRTALADSDEHNNGVYPPGRGWYYVVPWLPDIPTNASWRLQVHYGRTPSEVDSAFGFAKRFLGFTPVNKRRAEATLVSPEVRQ